ncbi:MAG: hypothetical protein KDI36_20210, partial [Pseudomonadales bacterium]|nr:hypothetical protein [Pseudomonadales bacterium]
IVTNVDQITTGMNENQDKIYRSIDNLEEVTASLAEVSRSLPSMITSVDQSLASLEGTMNGVDELLYENKDQLSLAIRNVNVLTEQASINLQQTASLLQAGKPVVEQLPDVMLTTDIALQSLTRLTDQLSRSWLLGGNNSTPSQPTLSLPVTHPHDDELYTEPASGQ